MAAQSRVVIDTIDSIPPVPILTAIQTKVRVEGSVGAVLGCPITPHDSGPHLTATISAGSSKVTFDGIAAARSGDLCTCGHSVNSGSAKVNVS